MRRRARTPPGRVPGRRRIAVEFGERDHRRIGRDRIEQRAVRLLGINDHRRRAQRAHHLRADDAAVILLEHARSEAHTSALQSLMRISYAVFCLNHKIPQYLPSSPLLLPIIAYTLY